MRRLLAWFRERRERERRDRIAIQRAIDRFSLTRERPVTGGHVIRREASEVIVRVMYFTNHIPPDRAWYAVPDHGDLRELTREESGDTAIWR